MPTADDVCQRIADRRAGHLTSGALSQACYDARCTDCGLSGCTCAHHFPQCPHCGSRFVSLMWAAMEVWDYNSWTCLHCDKRWVT